MSSIGIAGASAIRTVGENVMHFFSTSKYSVLIQVLIGLLVTLGIYVIALKMMDADKMYIDEKLDQNSTRRVLVVDGMINAADAQNAKFNTVVPFSNNYMPIRPSVNRRGGAQFSYSFWLFNGSPAAVVDKCIFIKGDPAQYTVERTVTNPTWLQAGQTPSVRTTGRTVYCPMVCFGSKPMEFSIWFNRLDDIHTRMDVIRVVSDQSTMRQNLMSLFSGQWVCITIIFEDNIPINDFENGIMVRFFVNDVLYQTSRFSGALKQNQGDLVLFPDSAVLPTVKLSNLEYFNYAISPEMIAEKVKKGPNLSPSRTIGNAAPAANPTLVQIGYPNAVEMANTAGVGSII